MEFSSLIFLFFFLPFFLLVLFVLGKKARNSFLLVASVIFYIWGEGKFATLLIISIIVNYILGFLVDILEDNKYRKAIFGVAIAFNIGLLVYFKYTHLILESMNIPAVKPIHLPLGISFLTFQALSFIIDIYRRTVKMDKDPFHFGLYMSFFPKLITGPIHPYHDLRGQVLADRKVTLEDFATGVKRFTLGLGKKLLVANTLAVPANAIFSIPAGDLTASLAWIGIVCYTLQVYFDFSGYTDMAIGVGHMCGFKLVENFNYPYAANSIKEFWRRWHISLAHWFRDYLFLPIAYSVSRKIVKPRLLGIKAENWAYYIAAMITFVFCGIWHGANWTFFIWGAYYGLLLVIEHAHTGRWMKRHLPKPLQIIYCQFFVMIGWVFFRSINLPYAFSYLKALFGFGTGNGTWYYPALYLDNKVIAFFVIAMLGIFPLFPHLNLRFREKLTTWKAQYSASAVDLLDSASNLLYTGYLMFILFASTMMLVSGTYNPFIYFRF